jgi:hypothetical protein
MEGDTMSQLPNPSPYLIGGNLDFGSVPGLNDYAGSYANALRLNQSNYANIIAGYQGLTSAVLGDISGIGASQSQAINDAYAQASGKSAQQMISAGLGNSTVQQSVQRGNLLDRSKAQIALANQLAQLTAGYQSQLGQSQLGFMNSVNAPYPNAQAYGQLALQQGYASRANQLYGQVPRGLGLGGGGGGGGTTFGKGQVPGEAGMGGAVSPVTYGAQGYSGTGQQSGGLTSGGPPITLPTPEQSSYDVSGIDWSQNPSGVIGNFNTGQVASADQSWAQQYPSAMSSQAGSDQGAPQTWPASASAGSSQDMTQQASASGSWPINYSEQGTYY